MSSYSLVKITFFMSILHNICAFAKKAPYFLFCVFLVLISCRSTKVVSVSSEADTTSVEFSIRDSIVHEARVLSSNRVNLSTGDKLIAIQFLPTGGTINIQSGDATGVADCRIIETIRQESRDSDYSAVAEDRLIHSEDKDSIASSTSSIDYQRSGRSDNLSYSFFLITFGAILAVIAGIALWLLRKRFRLF